MLTAFKLDEICILTYIRIFRFLSFRKFYVFVSQMRNVVVRGVGVLLMAVLNDF